jgi:hypothetical protein
MLLRHRSYTFILVTALCLVTAACGFRPMYGKNSGLGEDSPLSGNLVIDPIINSQPNANHEGQIFRVALEDKINPESLKTAQPEYKLHAALSKVLIPAIIKSDGTIERYNVQFNSTFQLIRIKDNKILLSSTLSRTGSYNVAINGNFATYEAEQDIIERTLQELAEDYVLRLTDYFVAPEKEDKDKP